MTARLHLPCDAGALAVGADEVAAALAEGARQRNLTLDLIRTGSRGLYWLEPMLEVATPEGRIAYGPVGPGDVASLLDVGLLEGGAHALRLGRPEDLPFLARQTRLTFARCGIVDPLSLDDYRAHGGWQGLERALALPPAEIVEEVVRSGLRGRGGAGFPTGIKWRTVLQTESPQK
jgi:formate dehydrogenase iron-sulfur subunit